MHVPELHVLSARSRTLIFFPTGMVSAILVEHVRLHTVLIPEIVARVASSHHFQQRKK
jgi:hypothetical protein